MESVIKGTLKSIVFESDKSPYKVLSILDEKGEKITAVGNVSNVKLEGYYQLKGTLKIHEKYGVQFNLESMTEINHENKDGLILYLSSGNFKGIGKKSATKIVESLGLDAINKIINEKNIEIDGLSKKKVNELRDILIKNREKEEIYIALYNLGLSSKMIERLVIKYGDSVISKINENPYSLIYDVDGFGFIRADRVAKSLKFKEDSVIRIKEAILYTINQVVNANGFTYLTNNQVINSTLNMLRKISKVEINEDLISSSLQSLISTKKLISKDDKIYLKYLYDAEMNVASRLKLIKEKSFKAPSEMSLISAMDSLEEQIGFKLTKMQLEAIKNAMMNKISIITGGPGTGKTTILKSLLLVDSSIKHKSINDSDYLSDVLLLAPTGKASKRMGVATGIKALTIHKALRYQSDGSFEYNIDHTLPYHFIIVDEASMIDICLMSHFLDAISVNTHLVIVGDKNQLPSVGPGNCLEDLINSKEFKTIMLNEIMRQKKDSNIIKLSQMVNQRQIDFKIFKEHNEVFFYNESVEGTLLKIKIILKNFIDSGGDLLHNIQILCPMYGTSVGIDAINKMVSEEFNKNEVIAKNATTSFKINDKVLQLQNDPKKQIMNGDEGIIKGISSSDSKELYIDFDGNMVLYEQSDLDNLTLAYAISIHKSQGSEYENVILPILDSYKIMLKRKLIYTAITRAKKKLILIGNPSTFNDAVKLEESSRQTSLKNLFINDKVIYINDPEIPFDTLGERNMENISPYSFMNLENNNFEVK